MDQMNKKRQSHKKNKLISFYPLKTEEALKEILKAKPEKDRKKFVNSKK